jgi:NAD(P)-dependent dehydrogenase (short-subunit alcohol dehydrogenase family)
VDQGHQRVALVTRADVGIGTPIVRGLAREGMTVIASAVDLGRGRLDANAFAGDGEVVLAQLDVTDRGSIRRAVKRLTKSFGALDVLVNNATTDVGYRPHDELTVDDMRIAYETNVFGVVAVTNGLMGLLSASPAARIVNVTSQIEIPGRFRPANSDRPSLPYTSAKSALGAITVHYAEELADTPIKVNAAAPGPPAGGPGSFDASYGREDAVRLAVRLATLPADGPTGGFFDYERNIASAAGRARQLSRTP